MADSETAGIPDEEATEMPAPEVGATSPNDVSSTNDILPVDSLPDADFSGNEEQGEPEEQEVEKLEATNTEEAEEIVQMTEMATTSIEEHLQSEQSGDDVNDDVTIVTHHNAVSNATPPSFPASANDLLQRAVLFDGEPLNGNGQKFPSLRPKNAHIPSLPSPKGARGQHYVTASKLQMMTHALNPKITFPAKVTMSARAKVSAAHPTNYVFNPRRSRKVVTWDAAMSARPPLRIDMEGPTPCTYSPATKPPLETNSPKWSFGSKTFVEKSGGSRTSWEKTWFQSSDVWTQKVDFHSDRQWPPPSEYQNRPALGPHHPVAKAGHSHSIGIRRAFNMNKIGSEAEPSPSDYSFEASDLVTRKRAPAYTHSLRRGGTLLWSIGESMDNPGPATYTPRTTYVNTHRPAFTIQGIRREKSTVLGPYASF